MRPRIIRIILIIRCFSPYFHSPTHTVGVFSTPDLLTLSEEQLKWCLTVQNTVPVCLAGFQDVAIWLLGSSGWFLSIWCDVKSVDVPQVPPSMRVYGILFLCFYLVKMLHLIT